MLRPLNDHVLVKVLEFPACGGAAIPDPMPCRESTWHCPEGAPTTSLRPNLTTFGEVVAVGPGGRLDGEKRVPPDVRIGDQVVLREPCPSLRIEVLIGGVRHWLVAGYEIAAVVMSPKTT